MGMDSLALNSQLPAPESLEGSRLANRARATPCVIAWALRPCFYVSKQARIRVLAHNRPSMAMCAAANARAGQPCPQTQPRGFYTAGFYTAGCGPYFPARCREAAAPSLRTRVERR